MGFQLAKIHGTSLKSTPDRDLWVLKFITCRICIQRLCVSCILLQFGAQISRIEHMSSWPAVPCLVVLSLVIVAPALHSLPSTVLSAAPASVSFLALSPLLSPCSCLPLLLGLPSLPLLISSFAPPLKAFESYSWEKKVKACGYQRRYISLPKFDFGPRTDLFRTSFGPR